MNDKSIDSSDGKEKAIKSPLEKALERIKVAYILAFISAGVTAIIAILSTRGVNIFDGVDIFVMVDAVLVLILGILLLTIKSRIAAVILFVYFLFSKAMIFIADPVAARSSTFMSIVFLMGFFLGILGTFSYHKIKKQQSLEAQPFSEEL